MAWLKVSFWLVSAAAAGWFRRGLACFAGVFLAREAGAFFLGTFFVAGFFFMCRQLGLRYGLRLLRHQLFKAFVGAQGGKLGVGVNLLDVLIAFFHGFAQKLQRAIEVARLGAHFGLLGVGVCVPGVVARPDVGDVDADVLGWSGMPLGRDLRRAMGVPVLIENDVKAFAVAQRLYGVGRSRRS